MKHITEYQIEVAFRSLLNDLLKMSHAMRAGKRLMALRGIISKAVSG